MDYNDGAVVAAALFFAVFGLAIALAFYVIGSWFLMKVFEKAGVQGKWRAWVPVYNTMIFCKLGDLNPWLILIAWGAAVILNWIPLIGWIFGLLPLIVSVLAAWRIGLKLQKEAVWVILYFFLALVWLGILAFDKSRWNPNIPPAPWAANSFLADRTNWAGIPNQTAVAGYGNPAAAGYPAPGAYPPPAGYGAPPAGYTAPPAGYTAPPPAGYTAPPPAAAAAGAGAAAASDAPAGYTPPPAPPAAAPETSASEASIPEPSAPPAAPEAPSAPGAPEAPAAPVAPEPPATPETPLAPEPEPAPEPPIEPAPPVTPEPAPPVTPEPAPPVTPEPPFTPEPGAPEPPTAPEDPNAPRA